MAPESRSVAQGKPHDKDDCVSSPVRSPALRRAPSRPRILAPSRAASGPRPGRAARRRPGSRRPSSVDAMPIDARREAERGHKGSRQTRRVESTLPRRGHRDAIRDRGYIEAHQPAATSTPPRRPDPTAPHHCMSVLTERRGPGSPIIREPGRRRAEVRTLPGRLF